MRSLDRPTLLLGILIGCCIISLGLLLTLERPSTLSGREEDVELAIRETFTQMGIASEVVRRREISIDSVFTRHLWIVDAPPSLSMTTLHYTLDSRLRPMGYTTPGRLELPRHDLMIHLYKGRTVRHTIQIRRAETDS